MTRHAAFLMVAALLLLATGGFVVSTLLRGGETVPLRWSEHDEIEVAPPADAAPVAGGESWLERTEFEGDPDAADLADPRVDVLLRGRVVDRFGAPQAGARVWLEFGRAGRGGPAARQRRVPDPVETDAEGRFAFAGQTFRSLRVSLQVLHAGHAPGLFDRDVGEVGDEIDLGDLVLERGGELIGRVTDLAGNAIAGATVEIVPENGNRMRFVRDRQQLLGTARTDNNGYFRRTNVAAGEWSVRARAKQHTEGRSSVFAVENETRVDVEDVRLGPGYEVTGEVRNAGGAPVAEASVLLRAARGGRRGGGEHRGTTDARGRFTIEHLPGVPMQLEVRAAGHLSFELDGVDPTQAQPLRITLQDGLQITGTVLDDDGAPIESFAVRAVHVRGLTPPAEPDVESPEARAMLRSAVRLGEQVDMERRALDRRGWRANARPEHHAGGRFAVTVVQEGVYEVHVQSPDHAPLRSEAVEVRAGATAPELRLVLDRGVYVAGVVRDDNGVPIAGARVRLRNPAPPRPADANGEPMWGRMREFARELGGVLTESEATTGDDGEFVLTHVPKGRYRLQAAAEGFAEAWLDPFEVDADRSAIQLQLGPLGAVHGTIRGLADSEHAQARVGAVPTGADWPGQFRGRSPGGGGPYQLGEIAADGSYRIDGLAPGTYVVRCWVGSPQELIREIGPKLFDGSLTPDVTVRGGEDHRLDLTVYRPQLGVVAGSVLHNSAPGAGLQVELLRADEAGEPQERGPFARGGWAGRVQRATVGASGRFRIDDVPAGSYRLRVLAGQRGVLHEEPALVLANSTTEVQISIETTEVAGRVLRADGGDPAEILGRVSLLPGLTEPPDDFGAWTRANTTYNARVQQGTFRFESVPPGAYLLVLIPRDRERTSQPVAIARGRETMLEITAGEVAIAPGSAPTLQPGAPRPR